MRNVRYLDRIESYEEFVRSTQRNSIELGVLRRIVRRIARYLI